MSMISLVLSGLHRKSLKALSRTILGLVLVSTLSACASQSPPEPTATIEAVITLEATATPFTLLPVETASVPDRPSSLPSNPPAYEASKANLPPDASFADEAEKDAYRALEIFYKSESRPPLTAITYQDYKAYLDQFKTTERISILQSWNGKTGDEYQMVTAPALNENWRQVVMWYGTNSGALMARPDAASDVLYKVVLPGYSHAEMLWGEDGNPYLFAIDKDIGRPVAWFNSTIAQAISEGGIEQAWTEIAPAAAPLVLEHYGLANVTYIQEGEHWFAVDANTGMKLVLDKSYDDSGVWLPVIESYTPLSADKIAQYQLPSEIERDTGEISEHKANIKVWIEGNNTDNGNEYLGLAENGTVIARFQEKGYEGATKDILLVLNEVVQGFSLDGKEAMRNLPSVEIWSEVMKEDEYKPEDIYTFISIDTNRKRDGYYVASKVRLSESGEGKKYKFNDRQLQKITRAISPYAKDMLDQLDSRGRLYMLLLFHNHIMEATNQGLKLDFNNDQFRDAVVIPWEKDLRYLELGSDNANEPEFQQDAKGVPIRITRIIFINPVSREHIVDNVNFDAGEITNNDSVRIIWVNNIIPVEWVPKFIGIGTNKNLTDTLIQSESSEEYQSEDYINIAPVYLYLTAGEKGYELFHANPYLIPDTSQ